jgi:hypothetical protein
MRTCCAKRRGHEISSRSNQQASVDSAPPTILGRRIHRIGRPTEHRTRGRVFFSSRSRVQPDGRRTFRCREARACLLSRHPTSSRPAPSFVEVFLTWQRVRRAKVRVAPMRRLDDLFTTGRPADRKEQAGRLPEHAPGEHFFQHDKLPRSLRGSRYEDRAWMPLTGIPKGNE